MSLSVSYNPAMAEIGKHVSKLFHGIRRCEFYFCLFFSFSLFINYY